MTETTGCPGRTGCQQVLPSASESPVFFPLLREDIDLYPAAPLADGSPAWVLHDPVANRFLEIGWLEFEILSRWRLGNAETIVAKVNRETSLKIEVEDVLTAGRFLQSQGFLEPESLAALQDKAAAITRKKGGLFKFLLHHYLFFRIPLFHPDAFLERSLWLVRPFFSRGFVIFTLMAGLLALHLILRQWDVFLSSSLQLISWDSFLFYLLAVIAAKCIHELGHACSCKLYGLNVPVIGLAFLVLWPFLYTDTGESWKLSSRRKRLVIVSAGMAAECCLAVFSTLAWAVLPPGVLRDACFFLATTSWVMTLAVNISPFMRWDGYYLLSDLTGIKNLQPRSMELAKWRLRECLFGFGDPPPEKVKAGTRNWMIVYAFAVWLYRLVVFLGIALLVYHFFVKIVGIFLMMVELYWFIWLPIQKELIIWYDKRKMITLNRHTLTTVFLLGILLFLFLAPWREYVLLPAVEKPRSFIEFYPSSPGKLVKVSRQEGAGVAAGELLYQISDPALERELALAKLEQEMAAVRLQRSAAADSLLGERTIALEQYTRALSYHKGLERRQKRLRITAPFSGVLVRQEESIQPGRWVSVTTPLGILAADDTTRLYAYASSDELARLEKGREGLFYPASTPNQPLVVQIKQINPVNVSVLPEPLLASINGGEIRVRQGERGDYIPEESIFQVELQPHNPAARITHIRRGYVRLQARAESFAVKVWRNTHGLFIRESGF